MRKSLFDYSLYSHSEKNSGCDMFAWSAKDLQGVDRDIIKHTLETDEKITPKKQKLRKNVRRKSEGSRS
jgi:hypothetical protein